MAVRYVFDAMHITVLINLKQILEALLFLEKSGFPYTHLHTGNVIVKGGVARYIFTTANSSVLLSAYTQSGSLNWKMDY